MNSGYHSRVKHFLISIFIGALLLFIVTFLVDFDSVIGRIVLGSDSASFPLTLQVFMWLTFAVGLGELFLRHRTSVVERKQLLLGLLPEDEETLLEAEDLGVIVRKLKSQANHNNYYLQRLLKRILLQFQSSRSIEQANSLMDSSLELYQHEVDMKYNMLKFIVWLIPTLGFLGTVIGITIALSGVGDNIPEDLTNRSELQDWIGGVTLDLGIAFNTTLLALALSAILVFLLHIIREREEMVLNAAGQYCMDNLITRLYITEKEDA